ncbi:tyrosine-type recombinase/integrase [Mycolicibacterium mucogenicum DSM 44124]|uniref:Integrase n=1 Tax=Mycolicibacterium mucogenicum DSM 44124 TaxID=1226753 RepID=A0A8H2J8V4_MYCMU|nr:tyrosine-type recombinase/integrase [Mycolicibacterium mucogenicum DSM 44124]
MTRVRNANVLTLPGASQRFGGGISDVEIAHPLITEWELWHVAARKSSRTTSERIRVINLFAHEADCNPVTVQPATIMRWLQSHEDDWSDSTAATYHSYLRAWFKWLIIEEHRVDDPMIKLGTPKYPERVPRPVPDDGLVKLLTARMHHRTRVMILLAALAGLRVSEIARVKGEDLDLEKGVIYIMKGKGKKRAALPLHFLLVEAAHTMPARGVWFPGIRSRAHTHVLGKSVSDIIGQAMRRAGTPGTPHCLRHWYGTTLLEDGADLRTVQELLRHSSLATTAIYTKVPDHRRHEAINKLDPFRAARRPVEPPDADPAIGEVA